MSKRKEKEVNTPRNYVAKHARTFNKAAVHRDRTKYYRKEKHTKSEDSDV